MLRWLPFRCAFLLKLYSYKPLYVRDFPLSRIQAPLILVDAAILIPMAFPYHVCASIVTGLTIMEACCYTEWNVLC